MNYFWINFHFMPFIQCDELAALFCTVSFINSNKFLLPLNISILFYVYVKHDKMKHDTQINFNKQRKRRDILKILPS